MIDQLDAQTRPPNRIIVIGQGYMPEVPRTAHTTVERLSFRENMGSGFRWRIVEEMDPGSIAVSLDDDVELGMHYIEESVRFLSVSDVDAISWGGVDGRLNWYFAWHDKPNFTRLRYMMTGVMTVPRDFIVGVSDAPLSGLLGPGGNEEAVISSWMRRNGHKNLYRPPGRADLRFTEQAYDARSGNRMMFDYYRQYFGVEFINRLL